MFKKFIQSIAEAVLALILPVINTAKSELSGKMDSQNNEITGIKSLVNSIVSMIRENETSAKEYRTAMAARNTNQESQIEQLKSQLVEIKKQLDENQKQTGVAVDEIKSCVSSISDNIPREIKEEAEKQAEARVQKLLEVKAPEDGEKPDYDQMAYKIRCQCNQEDVIIKDDLHHEVIRRLFAAPDITVSFKAGQIVVAKKTTELGDGEAFDPEEIRQQYEEQKLLANKIKYDSLLERQLEFVKAKVQEQIAAYKMNPYRFESVLLSEPDEAVSENQEPSEAVKSNPMYTELPFYKDAQSVKGHFFIFCSEVLEYLLEQGMVMELVPKDKETCKVQHKQYTSFWFYTSEKQVTVEQSNYPFEGKCTCYYFKGVAAVKLHILTPGEKSNMRNQ